MSLMLQNKSCRALMKMRLKNSLISLLRETKAQGAHQKGA
jgi:hypothetical protein